jgi:EmrB/QacA subfamily drug resistance transporter
MTFSPPALTARRSRHRVLGPGGLTIVCSSALFVSSLDVTVVNVALPALRAQLGAGPAQLQWVVDAYTLTLAVLLLLGGALGDRFGRRALFRTGLTLFGLGSLGCALAPSPDVLIGLRVLQAAGAALLQPSALSTITSSIGDPRQRARAIGVWAGVFGLAAAIGPLVGGLLIDTAGWRWIFLINLPVVATALLFSLRLPETRGAAPRPLDPLGIGLAAMAVLGLTYLLIQGAHTSYTAPAPLTAGVVAGLSAAAFIVAERRRAHPLFPLSLLRHRGFTAATGIAVLAFAILAGFLFASSLYWQQDRHASALGAGLALLPATLGIAIVSPVTGHLIHRLGPRALLIAAGVALTTAAALLIVAASGYAYLPYAAGYLALGAGFGLANPPITNTAVNGLPARQAGVASALATTSRQIGNTLGVAVLASVATRHAPGPSPVDLRTCWTVALAAALAITALAVSTPRRLPAPPFRAASLLCPPCGRLFSWRAR